MRAIIPLLLILTGCAGSLVAPLSFTEASRYYPPEFAVLIATEPEPTIAGDAAAFDGFLVAGADWRRVRAEFDRLRAMLAEAYAQSASDRVLAITEDRAKVEALKQCRRSKAEALAFGIGIGAGACAAVDRALDSVSPQP